MQQDHEIWMAQALTLAKQAAEQGEVPVGAVLVHQGQIVGRGWNQPISGRDPTAHAEIVALRAAAAALENYRLADSVLYVTIEPCTMCFGAMMHARVKTLVYGAREPRAGVCGSQLDLPAAQFYNHRLEVIGGVLAEQSTALLKSFFAARRR